MRKVLLFLTALLTVGVVNSNAQTYFCLTQTNGSQTIGGVTTNVTRSTPPPNSNNFCGVGPYQIGKDYSDWYDYDFQTDVTHVRIQMVRLHDDDTVRIYLNGSSTPWDATGSTSAFAGSCAQTSANIQTGPWGISTTNNQTGPGEGVQVDISLTPATISQVRVEHARSAANAIASDVYYSFCFADDSCSLGFVATIDTPQCSGRDVQLDVTDMPNTTYQWTWFGTFNNPTLSPSTTTRNPKILNVNASYNGSYVVTGTRGSCTYRDTVTLAVTQTPTVGQVTQTGPVCPDDADSLLLKSVNLPLGGKVYMVAPFGADSFNNVFEYYFPTMTTAFVGIYKIYAVGLQGCVSDTVIHDMKMKPDVQSSFKYEVKEGCDRDTVIFTDLSTGDSTVSSWWWFYDDPNGTTGTNQNPTFYYPIPAVDTDTRTYTVRLGVNNGQCFDTSQINININHRLWAHFDLDDDSICQGETITFTNNSFVKAATIPKYDWDFGDGSQDTTYDIIDRQFNVAGVYNVKFKITDFLGCIDSFQRTVVVDSAGGIFFDVDKTEVCLGEEFDFRGNFSAAGYNSIQWMFGDGINIPDSTQVLHSYEQAGTYDVRFAADYRICPDTFYERTVVVKPYPKVYIGEDTAICPNGTPIFIKDIVEEPGVSYTWHTSTKDVTPGIYVRSPGVYSVTAELDGCTAADTLEVKKDCYINIPNVFTPNGDGRGDYFLPRQLLSRSVSEFEMIIYNRWGEKVFETTSLNGRGWDGKYGGEDLPVGVYIYQMKVAFTNGTTERYQGNVTMLR